jgi:hypothetical protein
MNLFLNFKSEQMRIYLNLFLSIFFTFIGVFYAKSQTPADVLKHGTVVTFFGIDFSCCKGVLLGATAQEMKENYFPAINTLLLVEQEKYSIKRSLLKSDVTNTLDDVNKLNQTIDLSNFSVYSIKEVKPFDADFISQMINRYDLHDKEGIGLVFLAESLDKIEDIGIYHLVYFSMPEGDVILSEKVSGKTGGFGMRNYWAHTIHEILQPTLQVKLEKKYLPSKKK